MRTEAKDASFGLVSVRPLAHIPEMTIQGAVRSNGRRSRYGLDICGCVLGMRHQVPRPDKQTTSRKYDYMRRMRDERTYTTRLRDLEDRHTVTVRPLHLHVELFVAHDKDNVN